MADRILDLSTYRIVLKHNQLTTPESALAADPQLMHRHAAPIRRMIEDGNPDVLAALFGPLDWQAAAVDMVSHHKRSLSIPYDLDDPDGERRAWAALRAALRAGVPRSPDQE